MAIVTRRTIRLGDDFKIIISIKDRNGVALDATREKFKYIYKDVYNNTYEISYDGTTRINNYVDGGNLVGVFENYTLSCCVLKREAYYAVADTSFADGKWDYGDK
ncbi:MAG: hypothetical protein RSF94_01005 [Rikenellaceae bacterium]